MRIYRGLHNTALLLYRYHKVKARSGTKAAACSNRYATDKRAAAAANTDLMKKVITEKICDDFLSFIAFICVKHVEIGIGADACDTSEADLPDAEVAVIRRFIGILGEPHGA